MKLAKHCLCCGSDNIRKTPAILMPFISKRIFGYDYTCIDESWNLYNIDNTKALMLCQSLQCCNCEFLFCDMRFDNDEMSNLYEDYRGKNYVSLRDFYEPGYKNKNDILNMGITYKSQIEIFLNDIGNYNSILDWGGDDGINTPKFNAEKLFIYDISGKTVLPSFISLNQNELKNYNYDLIICSNVLEHVSYPLDLLSNIKNHMDENTVLYIEIPYEKIMLQKKISNKNEIKRHWHEHINFYSENSIQELLAISGLDIVKIKVYSDLLTENLVNFENMFMIACKKRPV